MAGHSHANNVKYRKDRQDQARSQLFLKLRKKIENIIHTEGRITEKVLALARTNQFPKEKVYQI
jgi:transcriptional/translational regulatory protein YebC/TACO1